MVPLTLILFNAILEKISDNDTYYIKHREGTNAFCITKDKKQAKKGDIIKVIETIDLKIKKSTNKSRISQLKGYRKELLNWYSSLGEILLTQTMKKQKLQIKYQILTENQQAERFKKMLR